VIDFLNVVFGIDQASHNWWKDELPTRLEFFFNVEWFPFESGATSPKDYRHEVFAANGKKGKGMLFEKIGMPFSIVDPFWFFDWTWIVLFSETNRTSLQQEDYETVWRLYIQCKRAIGYAWFDRHGRKCERYEYSVIVTRQLLFLQITSWKWQKYINEHASSSKIYDLELKRVLMHFVSQYLFFLNWKWCFIFILQAIEKYQQTLNAMSTNKESLVKCAISWYRVLLIRAEEAKNSDLYGTYFDKHDADIHKVHEYLQLALQVDPNDPEVLWLFAQYYEKLREFELSEGIFFEFVYFEES
jgi:hypothetical protein